MHINKIYPTRLKIIQPSTIAEIRNCY